MCLAYPRTKKLSTIILSLTHHERGAFARRLQRRHRFPVKLVPFQPYHKKKKDSQKYRGKYHG